MERPALVVAVFLLVMSAACSSPATEEQAESVEPGTAPSEVAGTSSAVPDETGIRTAGSGAADVVVRPLAPADLPPLPDGIEFIDLPAEIEMPIGAGPIEVWIPLFGLEPAAVRLAHLDAFGRWEFLEPFVDGERLVVLTNDFSPLGWVQDKVGDAVGSAWSGMSDAGEWVVGSVGSGVDWAADAVTGRSDPPGDCDLQGGEGAEWADHSGSPGNGFAHVCMRYRDDGRVEVVIRSNRSGPVEVILPDSTTPDWVWVEGMSDWATPIFAAVASTPNSYVLGPGRDMTIGYSRPIGQIPNQEIWIIQTGVAQAWGEMAGLVDGWNPDLIAANAMYCFVADDRDHAEAFSQCVQNGAADAAEKLTERQLDRRIDDAYLRMAEAIDADNLRWSRETIADFQNKFGSYRSRVLKTETMLARAKSFFRGLKASAIAVDAYTNIALSNFGSDEANLSVVYLTGFCPHGGAVAEVTVTGVADAVNLRSNPGTGSELIGEAAASSAVQVFLESLTEHEGRWWASVVVPDQERCGWVAADFLKTGAGELLAKPYSEIAAFEIIRRGLGGLEPQLLHATFVSDTEDPADGYPFDPAWTAEGLDQLATLGAETEIEGYIPPEIRGISDADLGQACAFVSHGSLCYFRLRAPTGDVVALAETRQYGDGITELVVTPVS